MDRLTSYSATQYAILTATPNSNLRATGNSCNQSPDAIERHAPSVHITHPHGNFILSWNQETGEYVLVTLEA